MGNQEFAANGRLRITRITSDTRERRLTARDLLVNILPREARRAKASASDL